jgi:hypothetical protein
LTGDLFDPDTDPDKAGMVLYGFINEDFSTICPHQHKSLINSIAAALLRIAA